MGVPPEFKEPEEVYEALRWLDSHEGSWERWLTDNGGEFRNKINGRLPSHPGGLLW